MKFRSQTDHTEYSKAIAAQDFKLQGILIILFFFVVVVQLYFGYLRLFVNNYDNSSWYKFGSIKSHYINIMSKPQ